MYQPALASQASTAATRTARWLIPAKTMVFSFLHASHVADKLPFRGRHRLHRQTAVFDQRHVFEFRFRLDRRERDEFWHRLDRSCGYGDPWLALLGGRIGVGLPNNFADPDPPLLAAGIIEEKLLALFHLLEMPPRGEVAHAAPHLTLAAALDLIVPGKLLRFGLHQPVCHPHSSAFNGRVSSDSMAASTLISSASSAATADEIGMSIACSRAISRSTGAVNMPSARPA